jgi:hypothetical protein
VASPTAALGGQLGKGLAICVLDRLLGPLEPSAANARLAVGADVESSPAVLCIAALAAANETQSVYRPSKRSESSPDRSTEGAMYSVRYGIGLSAETLEFPTARAALEAAEEYVAADRPNVVVIDEATKLEVSLDELRELAEAEAQAEDEKVAH